MRHHSGYRKLNRTSAHRLAMLRNMSNSLLRHEAIKTTLPKAKELRRVVEPEVLGPRFAKRNGGYTRILKMGFRAGDNAPMAYVELTERAEVAEEVKTEAAPAAEAKKAE